MIQIIIYTAVIVFTIVSAALFAYALYCVATSICDKKASFKTFLRELFPSSFGNPDEEGDRENGQ